MNTRNTPAHDLVVPAAIVAVMAAVAAFGFRGVFPDWSFVPAAVIGATGASLVMFGCRWAKLSAPEAILVSLFAFVLLGTVAARGVPTPGAFSTFFDGLIGGWAQVLSSIPPADVTAEYRVLPFTVAWFGAMVGCEVVRSSRNPALATIGPVLALALSLLITLENRNVALAQGAVMVIGALLLGFLQQRRRTHEAELFEDLTIEAPGRHTGWTAALAVAAAIAIASSFIGPRLPLAASNERFDLREYQTPPFDPLKQPSPLVQIKAALQAENADRVLFTVTTDTRVDRFPIAVLDHYNSEYWAVANEAHDALGQFRPVDSVFPPPVDATIEGWERVAATIEIVEYDEIANGDFNPAWLPNVGWPVSVSSAAPLDLRFNPDTGTVAQAPDGPDRGLVYDVVSAIPPSIDQLDLRGATVTKREPLDLAAPQLVNLAGDVLEGADVGWEQVQKIQARFVDSGFYDSREESETGRSGHRLIRLAEFVNEPERIAGFEEQYAATAALIARSEGLPARVVVGFLVDDEEVDDRWDGNRLSVVADDMSAWIEVNFDGIGWIPFDVTPPRERLPEDTTAGRSQREVAVPNPPPDPPPPVLPPLLDRDTDLEEEEEETAEDETEETTGDGIPVRTILIGSAAASPIALLLGGAGVVVALKRRRTRRRRHAASPSRQIAGAWHEVVDRFEELGAKPRRHATTLEFARGLEAAELVAEGEGSLLVALARDADEAAYHPSPAEPELAAEAWQRTDQLIHHIGQRQGVWSRLRHRIDPRPLLRKDPLIAEDIDG